MSAITLKNGATQLARKGNVVLADWNGQYVTWEIDSGGNTYWGHYWMDNLVEAAQDFEERAAKAANLTEEALELMHEAQVQEDEHREWLEQQDDPERDAAEAFQDKYDMYKNEY